MKTVRFLNTRPEGQNNALTQHIIQCSGQCVELPTLTIKPYNHWLQNLPALKTFATAIFISQNAVRNFLPTFAAHKLAWPTHLPILAIGKKTAELLIREGLPVKALPVVADSEHLLQLPELSHVQDKAILLIKGHGGRDLIQNTLQARGAKVTTCEVYQRCLPHFSKPLVEMIWQENQVDIILATSQESLTNLFQMFGEAGANWLRGKTFLVISERIAKKARSLGIELIQVCNYEDLPKHINQLCQS